MIGAGSSSGHDGGNEPIRQPSGVGHRSESSVVSPSVEAEVSLVVLSRRQQKKQVQRDARVERKPEKKSRKQADALQVTLAALNASLGSDRGVADVFDREELAHRFRTAFSIGNGYRELPLAYGPTPGAGLQALGSAVIRPPKYNAKFLPQEYSLLHKIYAVLGGDLSGAGVLDIGAGNANCAVLGAALLGLTFVCIERESPRAELRAEARLPELLQWRVIRVECDVEDFGTSQLREVAEANGLRRLVLVAKHPCGIGVDRSIDFAARLRGEAASMLPVRVGCPMPEVVGVVIACCCTNKISLDDMRVSRVAEFCSFYGLSIGHPCGGERAPQVVELMSRCSAWRTASASEGNAIQDEQLAWAELFEDAIQAPRRRRLERAFGACVEVRFAPGHCTMQDRCLVAASHPIPAEVFAHGEDFSDEPFLARLRAGVKALLETSGPIDCRPHGLRSDKYDFDYTDNLE